MSLSELQINARRDLFEQLELMSSKAEQLEYRERVPIAYISDELFWGWADAYTDKESQPWFSKVYTPREHEILKKLNVDINRIRNSLPKNLPVIETFIDSPEWIELVGLARKALTDLKTK